MASRIRNRPAVHEVSTNESCEAMKGAIRKPRTAGGAWSYRLHLGFDDAGKRRQRQGRHTCTVRVASRSKPQS